jgi:hypothetical protein
MQMNRNYNGLLGKVIFIGAFIGLFFLYHLNETLFYPPQSVHIWRQTNSLSIAHNYYQDNLPFLQPEMHNQFCDQGNSGKAVGEFPVIYYFVGQLWKLFGKQEWIFKLVHLTILFFGLYALFLGASRIIKNRFFAGFLSLLVFTSPMLVYYGLNFLPDVPALSFVFIAWYFMLRFTDQRKMVSLWVAAAFFCLAMLLKITSALSFIALGGWILYELIFQKENARIFRFRWVHFLPFSLVILFVFAWYWYAGHYNNLHGGHFSYHGIWPVWEMSKDQFHRIIDALDKIYFKELFLPFTQYVTGILWLALILFYRKLTPVFRYFMLVLPAGFIMQNLLWFQVLEGHDYYVINLLVVLVAVWIVFLTRATRLKRKYQYMLSVVLAAFLIWNALTCQERARLRYEGWMNEMYNNHFKALNEIQPIFEEWGIQPDDKVISIPDYTINGSLYFMNRKGYTDFGSDFSKRETYFNRMEQGAKYLIINDSTVLNRDVIQPFIVDKIGQYKNVFVYDLTEVDRPE